MEPRTDGTTTGGEPVAEGFDARLGRLEEIVGALEEGGLELEDALARYKEGVALPPIANPKPRAMARAPRRAPSRSPRTARGRGQ